MAGPQFFASTTRRHTGGWLAFSAKWINRLHAWAPVLVAVWAWSWLYEFTGSHATALFVVALLAGLTLFGYWRWRIHRAKAHLRLADVALQLFHCFVLRRAWPRACDAAYLSRRRNNIAPYLGRFRLHDDGTISAVVRNGRYGVATEALVEEASKIAQFLGCYEMAVKDLRLNSPQGRLRGLLAALGPRSGVSQLRFFYDDPTGRLMRLSELPVSPDGTLAYGRRRDGSAAYIQAHLSVFAFGLTGFGKSNLMWTLLADALRKRVPIRLYVSDPKMGMELQQLGAVVGAGTDRFQVRAYAKTPAETERMLGVVEEAMGTRMRQMAERGQRKHKPTVEEPLVVVLLDETLKLTGLLKKGEDSPLGRIVYTGRAAGYAVWALTQAPQKEVMGQLRDLIPQRICLAAPNRPTTDAALGDGATSSGAECHLIDRPGVGYSFVEGDRRPQKFRSPLVSDREIDMIAHGLCPDMADDEVKGDPHCVYRYWGVLPTERFPQFAGEEVLFYVGHTNDFERRDREHAASKAWYEFVTRKDESEVWPSKNRAKVEEQRAIDEERPIFNEQHNGENVLRAEDAGVPWNDPRRSLNPFVKRRAGMRS